MRTITGLFDRYADAAEAVRALEGIGVPTGDIALVARGSAAFPSAADASADAASVDAAPAEPAEPAGDGSAEGAGAGAGIGAVLGGTGGLLAGLGALAIPGIGPVVAGGWLLATAVGAVAGAAVGGAAGGILGSLVSAGVPEPHAHVYAEGLRRGGAVVTARVDEHHAALADEILHRAAPVDIDARRAAYEAEGWAGFDETGPAFAPEDVRDYRHVTLAQREVL